jgi:hypothetical protein
MSGKIAAWILFLVMLLLLSLSVTPYSKTATYALLAARLSAIAVVSVLTIRERWKHRDDAPRTAGKPDAGDRLLARMRRWYHGETH